MPGNSHSERLRGLIEAGIGSKLSLDALLLKLAETAAGLTGAATQRLA